MSLSDDDRARLAAKYESPAWKPGPLPSPPVLRSPRAGVWAATLLVFGWLLLTMRIPLQRCDDIYFYIGARSLASGQGFSDISRPDRPPQLKYPPLRSVLQLPFLPLLKENIRPLRAVSCLFFAALLPLAYALLAPSAGHRAALWAIVLAGLSPMTARMANFEGNFGVVAFSWVLTFYLAERVRTGESRQEARWGILLGLALALAFYAHRMAFALIPSTAAYLFLLGRRRAALLSLGIAAALAFPWLYRSWRLSGHWISPDYEAEISGRIRQETGSTLTYMLRQAGVFPGELGYGLFPWWKASGGAIWPQLRNLGLGWLGPLSAGTVAALLLIGWGRSLRRAAGLAPWYFPVHTLMLLAFFVGFQYYAVLYPWLFYWLYVGVRTATANRLGRSALTALAALLLLVGLGKGVRAFLLFPTTPVDRDTRWGWIARIVPEAETVRYLGLDNYAFAPLRWFDSGRMALGVSEEELGEIVAGRGAEARWLCLPATHPAADRLKAAGWRRRAFESFRTPPQELLGDLSDAQRNFLRRQEPPQALWMRD